MNYLHENFILHRDIKPNNNFLKSGHLKLANFGFCKRLRGTISRKDPWTRHSRWLLNS